MDNTYIALKKILNIMVPEKYPMVSDIKVIDDSNDNPNYIIYLGVSPDELDRLHRSDIRDYVREVSSYVLKGDEALGIIFYNPELW